MEPYNQASRTRRIKQNLLFLQLFALGLLIIPCGILALGMVLPLEKTPNDLALPYRYAQGFAALAGTILLFFSFRMLRRAGDRELIHEKFSLYTGAVLLRVLALAGCINILMLSYIMSYGIIYLVIAAAFWIALALSFPTRAKAIRTLGLSPDDPGL